MKMKKNKQVKNERSFIFNELYYHNKNMNYLTLAIANDIVTNIIQSFHNKLR